MVSWIKAKKLVAEGKYEEAIFIFRRIESEGKLSALVEIGKLYEKRAYYEEKNYKRAVAFYRKAIHLLDDKYAYLSLGRLYLFDKGVEFSVEKGVQLLEESSRLGCGMADLTLARLYSSEQFLPRNTELSEYYFNLAISRGNLIAKRERAVLKIKSLKFFPFIFEFVHAVLLIYKTALKDLNEHDLIVSDSIKEE